MTFYFVKFYLHDCALTTCSSGTRKSSIFYRFIFLNRSIYSRIDQLQLNLPLLGHKRIRKKQISFSQIVASIILLHVDMEEVNDKLPSYEFKKKKQCIEFGEEKPSVKIYFPLWSVN
jgi:hypothetical protein